MRAPRRFAWLLSACVAWLVATTATAHAAAAEVWPSKARRLDDGRIEYTYDLRALKSGQVTIDLGADADDAAVAAFRKALPNETKVVVSPTNARVKLHAPGGLEAAPLASSFARVAESAFVPGPFDPRARKQGVPAFHPDAPRLLPSADLLLWRQQLLEDEIEAGLLDALQNGGAGLAQGRQALFERILAAAAERAKSSAGDSQLGARRLAARIAAQLSVASGRMPNAAKADPEILSRASAEAEVLSRPKPRFPPRPMFLWNRRLAEAHAWDAGLATPFGTDREGVAAALTLLAILESDPALAKAYDGLRAQRDLAFANPGVDRLDDFRAALGEGGATAALDRMGEFLARLGSEALELKKGAPPFAAPQTPAQRFIAQLQGAEQVHAIDELTLAVQDGRVSLEAETSAGWCAGRDAWLRDLLRPEAGAKARLVVTGEYKDRLTRTFQALYGLDADIAAGEASDGSSDEVGEARVRLMAPPLLEVEPLADAYERAAQTWTRLAALASANPKLGQARGVSPDGSARGSTLAKDAQAQAQWMRGLALAAQVAAGGPPPVSDADRALLKSTQKFLAAWRTDAELARDVRYLLPVGEALDPGMVLHSGLIGIGRRELEASFEGAPEATVQAKDASLFEPDTSAVQRYQVPVLVTGAVTVARAAPMDQAEFRALCDKVGRTREGIVSALPNALVKTMKAVGEDAP